MTKQESRLCDGSTHFSKFSQSGKVQMRNGVIDNFKKVICMYFDCINENHSQMETKISTTLNKET